MKTLNFRKKMNPGAVMRLVLVIAVFFTGSVSGQMNPPGNALDFDGTNDYVTANLVTTATDNFTIEAWVKWDGTFAGNQMIFGNGQAGSNGYMLLAVNTANSNNISVSCAGINYANASVQFVPNAWQHIAAVKDVGMWKLYIDGVQQSMSGNLTCTPNTPAGLTTIGGNIAGGTNFDGQADEVRVWNVARTQAQIKQCMNTTLAGNEPGLAAYYNFDHASGTGTLDDLTANNNDGILTNMDTANDWVASGAVLSAPGNTLEFDGIDDCVRIPFSSELNVYQQFTIEFWMKPQSLAPAQQMIITNRHNDAGAEGYAMSCRINSGVLSCFDAGGGGVSYTLPYADIWYHIAFTYDGTDFMLFADGTLTDNQAGTTTSCTNPWGIGRRLAGTAPFTGSLDEIRIWNIPRTQAQIQDNMNNPLIGNESGLVAYYRFDQGGGTTLTDYTSNNNHATLISMDPSTDWVSSTALVLGTKNLLVDNIADVLDTVISAGNNTLANAIHYADNGDTITFDSSIAGQTLTLVSEFYIDKNLAIDGGTNNITVSGNNSSRVFNIGSGNVTISNLTIADGDTAGSSGDKGGGILVSNGAVAKISNCTFDSNTIQPSTPAEESMTTAQQQLTTASSQIIAAITAQGSPARVQRLLSILFFTITLPIMKPAP